MKKKLVFSIFTTILFFISCKNNLVSSALIENQSSGNSSRQISAPQDIRAIGGKRKIVLEWTESENATSYNIYAANTQFDEFQKIGTSTTTTFTYNASHSVTRYFKIVAENRYMQTTSAESLIVKGYTLAKPTITSITTETTDSGTETTVYWYMENVDDYQEYVRYEIICYDDSTQVTEMQVSGAETDLTYCVFENLPQNKNLQFEVNAYFTFAQSEVETSVKMDTKTAAMQTPKAAGGFSASNGTAPDKISLTFTLPEPSYKKVGSEDGENTFEQKALFFKIYRRLANDSRADKKWGDEDLIVAHLYYDGTEEEPGVKPADGFFDNYNSGALVTFIDDKNIAAGKKYEYKIQSYVDDCEEIITSEKTSVTYTSGWTCGLPTLRTDEFMYKYDNDNEEKRTMKISAVLDFKAAWENFGNEKLYKFIVETKKTTIGLTPETTYTYKLYNSIADIVEDVETFNLAKFNDATETYETIKRTDENNIEGQYEFKIYVVKAEGATETKECADTAITEAEAPGYILIISDMGLPELKGFAVKDGYKDKVEISWDKENVGELTYSLERYTIDEKGNKIPNSETTAFTLPTVATENKFSFTDETAQSGEIYVYTLTATTQSDLRVPSNPLTAITLGTPAPVFDNENPKLETITISWPQISKPKDDVVKYSVSLVDETNTEIEFDFNEEDVVPGSDERFTYTISKPAGYNNANISGKDWKIVVEAKNTSKDNDTTTSAETIVKTLGPANLTAETTPSKSTTEIEVSWNTIPGTKRYAVVRSRYEVTDTTFKGEHSTNIYYVSPTGTVLGGDGDNLGDSVIATVEENKIILKDKYKENKSGETSSDWDKDQDKLAWGFPYTYTVIPLDSETATVDDNGKIKTTELAYINLSSKRAIGSCKGYGHNVRATKAEDPYAITITWDEPYGIGTNTDKAKLYYKRGENGTWSHYTGSSYDKATQSFTVEPSGETNPRTGTYYFAVAYEDKKPNDTYLSDTITKKDTVYSPTESLNKGYTYSLDLKFNIQLENGVPGLEEGFEWTTWDYRERAIGPADDAKIELCLFNNDFVVVTDKDDGWRTIAEIDKNGNVTPYDENKDDNTKKYNVAFTKTESTGVIIKPKAVKDADHQWYNGLLKVQRDYKHYAKLVCDRKTQDEKTVKLSWADKGKSKDDDLLVYGYRNFTDGEIARMALLVLSYGFYLHDNGNPNLSNMLDYNTKYGEEGDVNALSGGGKAHFSSSQRGGGTGKYQCDFYFTEYNCSIKTPGGNSVTPPIAISCDQQTARLRGDQNRLIYMFESSFDITVISENKECPISKTVTLGVSDYDNLTLKIKQTGASTSTTLVNNVSDKTNTRIWFPMRLMSNEWKILGLGNWPTETYWLTSTDYDWWGE